jgi:hypothetical protein
VREIYQDSETKGGICGVVLFQDKGPLCSSGWPRTCDPPAVGSHVLGLQAFDIMPGLNMILFIAPLSLKGVPLPVINDCDLTTRSAQHTVPVLDTSGSEPSRVSSAFNVTHGLLCGSS